MSENIAKIEKNKSKDQKKDHKTGPRKRRVPKKISETYLHNSGLYYLQRFAASSGQFRSVMMRKIKRSCQAHQDQDEGVCIEMLDALITKFQNVGLLDDDVYTRALVTSLRRRGVSRKGIVAKLQVKYIAPDTTLGILDALDAQEAEDGLDPELKAALQYARRRRLGPFDIEGKKDYEKSLAAMARQGFSYEIARKALDERDDQDLF